MVAEIHEALREVHGADTSFGRELRSTRDELMLPEPAERHVEDAGQPVTDVIPVEHGAVRDLPEAISAHPENVGVRSDQEGAVPVPRPHLPDRLRTRARPVSAP